MEMWKRKSAVTATGFKCGGIPSAIHAFALPGIFQSRPDVEQFLRSLPMKKVAAVEAISKSLEDLHGHYLAPIIHGNYYQKEAVSFTTMDVEAGLAPIAIELQRGILHHLLYRSEEKEAINLFLDEIVTRFHQDKEDKLMYPNLFNVPRDSSLLITMNEFSTLESKCTFTVDASKTSKYFVQDYVKQNLTNTCDSLWAPEKLGLLIIETVEEYDNGSEAAKVFDSAFWTHLLREAWTGSGDTIVILSTLKTIDSSYKQKDKFVLEKVDM